MVHRSITSSIIALLLVSAITACTPNKKPASNEKSNADIFSNRPIQAVPDVYVVTLNSPALLAAGTKTAKGWNIPDSAKQAVLNEQAAFEKQLAQQLPDAKIIYRYRLVLNGLAVYASEDVAAQMLNIGGVKNVTPVRQMSRPLEEVSKTATTHVEDVTSVSFIGADEAHKLGFSGQGMRVGIIDTGIDYTHKMLGGTGNPADYKSVDPNQPSQLFPNKKVIGGVDLVGTDFDAASPFTANRLPHPDANPLDEAGHGTHVAGTVAGVGDGVNTYSGVAPDASLYAIKVFGKDGSTMDATVIAGFEYAADPNGDLNPDDQLDVVNLSLGGGFGQPQILYNEAVRNLTQAGTVVVCAAGNSGPIDYIVGAPGTADEALSVAASIDGSPHNWQFASILLNSAAHPGVYAKAIEGPITVPVAKTAVTGSLVDVGFADTDLSDEVKAALKGKVALISRGKNNFTDKLQRVQAAGAIGAVVYNNDSGDPIPMGGDSKVDIPGVMLTQALGLQLVADVKAGDVTVQFHTDNLIKQPELIDTITSFSSKGPRSEDNLIKPEIAAPGQAVISAAMGQGDAGVAMDGTSMASPHMTGAMTLIKQAHPGLSVAELKSLAMDNAKVLPQVPIELQGAGRIQIAEAVQSPIVVLPASLSLGRVQLQSSQEITRTLTLKNLTNKAITLKAMTAAASGLQLRLPATVTVPAKGQTQVTVTATFQLNDTNPDDFAAELDGRIAFVQGQNLVAQLPALAVRTPESAVSAQGAPDSLALKNASPVAGLALAFNLLGESQRKPQPKSSESYKSRSCDLQSVGYRILQKPDEKGVLTNVIQFGFKLYTPVTTWNLCEVSVLIDSDGDGIADQELAGVSAASIEGVTPAPFFTALLDAKKARALRVAYETALNAGKSDKLDYTSSMISVGAMAPFPQSTLAVIEMPIDALAKGADGNLHIKAAALAQGGDTIEADDYLGKEGLGDWLGIAPTAGAEPFSGMDEFTAVTGAGANLKLSKGASTGKLVLYYPMNTVSLLDDNTDTQSQVIAP
jgi:subtilisin family serine protease